MYAEIDLATDTKLRELRDLPRLIQPGRAYLAITYADRPTIDADTQVAERQEDRFGDIWRKTWAVRDLTPAERDARVAAAAAARREAILAVAARRAAMDRANADHRDAPPFALPADYPSYPEQDR